MSQRSGSSASCCSCGSCGSCGSCRPSNRQPQHLLYQKNVNVSPADPSVPGNNFVHCSSSSRVENDDQSQHFEQIEADLANSVVYNKKNFPQHHKNRHRTLFRSRRGLFSPVAFATLVSVLLTKSPGAHAASGHHDNQNIPIIRRSLTPPNTNGNLQGNDIHSSKTRYYLHPDRKLASNPSNPSNPAQDLTTIKKSNDVGQINVTLTPFSIRVKDVPHATFEAYSSETNKGKKTMQMILDIITSLGTTIFSESNLYGERFEEWNLGSGYDWEFVDDENAVGNGGNIGNIGNIGNGGGGSGNFDVDPTTVDRDGKDDGSRLRRSNDEPENEYNGEDPFVEKNEYARRRRSNDEPENEYNGEQPDGSVRRRAAQRGSQQRHRADRNNRRLEEETTSTGTAILTLALDSRSSASPESTATGTTGADGTNEEDGAIVFLSGSYYQPDPTPQELTSILVQGLNDAEIKLELVTMWKALNWEHWSTLEADDLSIAVADDVATSITTSEEGKEANSEANEELEAEDAERPNRPEPEVELILDPETGESEENLEDEDDGSVHTSSVKPNSEVTVVNDSSDADVPVVESDSPSDNIADGATGDSEGDVGAGVGEADVSDPEVASPTSAGDKSDSSNVGSSIENPSEESAVSLTEDTLNVQSSSSESVQKRNSDINNSSSEGKKINPLAWVLPVVIGVFFVVFFAFAHRRRKRRQKEQLQRSQHNGPFEINSYPHTDDFHVSGDVETGKSKANETKAETEGNALGQGNDAKENALNLSADSKTEANQNVSSDKAKNIDQILADFSDGENSSFVSDPNSDGNNSANTSVVSGVSGFSAYLNGLGVEKPQKKANDLGEQEMKHTTSELSSQSYESGPSAASSTTEGERTHDGTEGSTTHDGNNTRDSSAYGGSTSQSANTARTDLSDNYLPNNYQIRKQESFEGRHRSLSAIAQMSLKKDILHVAGEVGSNHPNDSGTGIVGENRTLSPMKSNTMMEQQKLVEKKDHPGHSSSRVSSRRIRASVSDDSEDSEDGGMPAPPLKSSYFKVSGDADAQVTGETQSDSNSLETPVPMHRGDPAFV